MKKSETGLLCTYNSVLRQQGRSEITALDVEKLPGAVHSDGHGVFDKNEATDMKHTGDG